jgi:hypothetical protein
MARPSKPNHPLTRKGDPRRDSETLGPIWVCGVEVWEKRSLKRPHRETLSTDRASRKPPPTLGKKGDSRRESLTVAAPEPPGRRISLRHKN